MRDIAMAGAVGLMAVALWYVLLLIVNTIPIFGGLVSLAIPWDLGLAAFLLCGAVLVFFMTGGIWGPLLLAVAGCVVLTGIVPLGSSLAEMIAITGG